MTIEIIPTENGLIVHYIDDSNRRFEIHNGDEAALLSFINNQARSRHNTTIANRITAQIDGADVAEFRRLILNAYRMHTQSSSDETEEIPEENILPERIPVTFEAILAKAKHSYEFEVEACVMACDKQVENPPWLAIVSPPSTGKSKDLKTLHAIKTAITPYSIMLDQQSENGLAAARPNTEAERALDVFSQANNHTLIYNDLGSMFGDREDKVRKFIGYLTAAFGGQFNRADPTEVRHYDTHMGVIVAMTPQLYKKNIGMFSGFGNRFLLLKYVENSPDEVFDDDEHVTTVTEQEAFSLITAALERPWEFTIEDGVVDALKTFAIQSTRIRSMMWGETAHDIEKPHRLFNQLKNLMKSRARLYNRTVVTMADFEFVKPLIWLTLPYSNALMHLTEGLVSNRIPRKYKDMCRNGKKLGILVRSDIDGYMIENQKPEQYTFSEAYREIMEEFTAYMTNLGYTLTTLEDDE